ncbi:sulfate ABC transporter substrate-binding protein [Aeromicrobium duanguangcaii]|uniref:Sulfate ABC transporter substrate-binding protein n=1 Tax=Aeromicrobium duanguangcaii TaxID=2968086 RepID=A0ABY5KC89_9ACTN|nr:sulfate ABC transporter substrate-binding protein [Aeromicrobium duanguangcaii]MCD9155282.1 sulfate ABC transporter substrate-binding protein [Aeromicrobium duanguangcaii]MCL3838633.1 sulfate ABC transporter substrate-binding protein [Aeromicrobium duanguangcaii]UUI68067.1 sulfate ABC transporter substrate-binding protein [Aeromicrobium duanguangcaii]
MTRLTRPRPLTALGLLLSAALLASCAPSSGDDSGEGTELDLVGFAVPKAGNNAAQKAFAATDAGDGVTWKESYGASGDQSRAVAGGLPADYVHFSVTPDVTRLVEKGLVAEDWNAGANQGIVTDSVVVLVVREGNPKKITGWDDLVKPGVGIVTPNPGSSGAARWNVLAAWQHVIGAGGSQADAEKFLGKLFANVKALPGSGRDATTAFQGGTGDVLISYENEAILARQLGEKIDYVVPEDTLLIENPAAVTKDADPAAKKFLEFVLTPEGQKEYVSKGFRPLSSIEGVEVGEVEGANDPANPFPTPKKLFTIEGDLGGWEKINAEYFDEDKGIITKLLAESGKS